MKPFAVLITLLRDRKTFLGEIRRDVRVERKITSLLVSSSVFFAIYGAIIGSSSSWLQMIASAIKLPALYLITLIICLPTLFFFDILFGSALGFAQYTAMVLTTVAVISVLLFSFAPITLFFLISVHDYNFFLLLNVAIFALTGLVGINLLYQGMQTLTKSENTKLKEVIHEKIIDQETIQTNDFEPLLDVIPVPEDGLAKTRKRLLQFWLVLYGLVGSQLGWTLRPFFGAPTESFQLFRNIEGNFYTQVFQVFLHFLGVN